MSYTRSYFHIVFGTKYHIKCISRDRKSRLYAYITNSIKNKKSSRIAINGMEEHVHILVDLHPTVSLADLVKTIKQTSSRWLTETFLLPLFEGWSSEYYACSVSPSHVKAIEEYIANQEIHHSQKEYKNEMKDFVEKMGMTLYQDFI